MDLFIELLQIALDHRVTLSRLPNYDEWCSIYNTARKQAVVGVLFEGIQVLSNVYAQYHHMDFPIFQDVEVEVHYKPSRINNPFYNWRLQRFYQNCKSLQFNHECRELDSMGNVCTPLRDFNLIFQLSHIMNHFFTEGVGLR